MAPKSPGMDAMEIWIIVCIIMIFASLCEYALILVVKFKKPSLIGDIQKMKNAGQNYSIQNKDNMLKQSKVSIEDQQKRNVNVAILIERKIDRISLMLFPLVFLVFVFVFFMKY